MKKMKFKLFLLMDNLLAKRGLLFFVLLEELYAM